MPETLFLIDTFSLMFQVFHAIPPMSSPKGEPVNAVFGFCRDVLQLLRQHQPDYLVCAWDAKGENLRNAIYPEYKANRSEMPEDLRPQIPRLRTVLEAFPVPVIDLEGWEADDVIATLTRQAVERGVQVRIVTSDKDARQLLGPLVQLYNIRKNQFFDEAFVLADWGVRPDQVVDFQSLVGDAVDNVPGVPLVGPKKAAQLLQQFGTLEQVLANADLAPGAKLRENLKTFADQALMSRELVRLRQDLPIAADWEQWRVRGPLADELVPHFREAGFRKLVDEVRALSTTPMSEPATKTVSRKKVVAGQRSLFDDDDAAPTQPVAAESHFDDDAMVQTLETAQELEAAATLPSREPAPHGSLVVTPFVRQSWRLIQTQEDFERWLPTMPTAGRICLDLETTGLDPMQVDIVGWAFCWQAGQADYIAVRGPAGEPVVPPEVVVAALKPLLESPALEVINQNIKYDMLVLRRVGICLANWGLDPMVGDYLLDAGARSHGLEWLSEKYFGHRAIPISALIGTGKQQKSMAEVPLPQIAEYATEDADLTWQLCERLEPELTAQGLWPLYRDVERPLIGVLAQMEHHGIRVDVPELQRQSAELTTRLAELMGEIYRAAEGEFNIDSPVQLRKILFDKLGLPVIKKTKTGPSTDQEVLEELAPLHELPRLITEHRQLSKLKGTYLDALPLMVQPSTGRIHCSFHQTVAATGRLSSSDPNLQNIPIRTDAGRRIRRAFTPHDPAWRLVCADYSQIELRVLAHFCEDPVLVDAFRRGIDIHTAVAADVYHVAAEAVDRDMRRVAKAVNFGVIYGQSAFGLAAALGIPKDEAARFIDGYFARFAGVSQYLEEILDETTRTGFATTILGRRRAIDGIRPVRNRNRTLPERTAINTVIQGSAADLIKQAMLRVTERMAREQHPARLLLQIHDELVFESPEAEVPTLCQLVREEMEHAMDLRVPLVVDVSVGPNWLDCEEVR